MRLGDEFQWDVGEMGSILRTNEMIEIEGVMQRIFEDKEKNRYVMVRISVYQPLWLDAGDTTTMLPGKTSGAGETQGHFTSPTSGGDKPAKKTEVKAPDTEKPPKPKPTPNLATRRQSPTDLEREDLVGLGDVADIVEAKAISMNSDLVLQYEAPFKNHKTGKTETRKWLGVNAWKLGLIEQYIQKGFSCDITYQDTDECRICDIRLNKGDQEVHVTGSFTKNRLKGFLSPAKDECFDTFAYRNAIKKIVSMRELVEAVQKTHDALGSMGMLPTRSIEG